MWYDFFMSHPKLSVVIPAYNEEKRIRETLEETDKYLRRQNYPYEIIVVDNGSNDRTCDVVKHYQESTVQNLVSLCLSKSIGAKGSAVKLGIMDYAHGDVIMFMDADNATPISEIEKFLPYLESGEYQIVIGSRELDPSLVHVKQTFKRRVLGKMSHLLIRAVLLPGIYDTQLGFKAFRREAAKEIFSGLTVTGWGFDMEVLTIARRLGHKIKEVPVIWVERGGSHVPFSAFLESLLDLIKIRINLTLGKYRKSD